MAHDLELAVFGLLVVTYSNCYLGKNGL